MDTIKVLMSLPSEDGNFKSSLATASLAQLKYAVQLMKMNGKDENTSRIKACESRIASLEKEKKTTSTKKTSKPKATASKATTKATTTSAPKKEEKIEVTPMDKSKKPKVVPFKTKAEGNHTYKECEAKLNKELEKFIGADSAYVVEAVLERCRVDEEFRNNVMRKEKSYEGFYMFMADAARNGYCIKYGNVGGEVDKDTAVDLAFDYFSGEPEKKKVEASIPTKAKTEEKSSGTKKPAPKKETEKKETKKDDGEYEQLSFVF